MTTLMNENLGPDISKSAPLNLIKEIENYEVWVPLIVYFLFEVSLYCR
jgi:hypothetical protein